MAGSPTFFARRSIARCTAIVTMFAALSACGPNPGSGTIDPTTRNPLARGVAGVLGNDATTAASLSGDGTIVAFTSLATNLGLGPTSLPAFGIRDLTTDAVVPFGNEWNGHARVSADGDRVVWGEGRQIHVLDRITNATTMWTRAVSESNLSDTPFIGDDVVISGNDGLFGLAAPFCTVHHLSSGLEESCPADGFTNWLLTVSANGRFVLYRRHTPTGATELVRWDRTTNATTVLDVESLAIGGKYNAISDDGTVLATTVVDGNALAVTVHDLATATSHFIPTLGTNPTLVTGISADGNWVLFGTNDGLIASDTNGVADMYRWYWRTNQLERLTDLISASPNTAAGTSPCGVGPGQILNDGRACLLSPTDLIDTDTNGRTDAYLAG